MQKQLESVFPPHFRFGVSSSAYQIEGTAPGDGMGRSVWDMFAERKGVIENGETALFACEHVARHNGDVELLKALGIQSYRLSVSWPRLLPDGLGRPNEKGVDFYSRLIDRLLAADIEPWVTLFHWDFPLALFHRGGWLHPDSPKWFAEYAAVVARLLGDRVRHFFTLNEPQVYLGLGHHTGTHAPGLCLPFREVLLAGHNTLLAHGHAVRALRASSALPPQIGMAPVAMPCVPKTESRADIEAARAEMFAVPREDVWTNSWWMDPVFLGRYPEEGLERYAAILPRFGEDDFRVISEPTDFLGVNIYQGDTVEASESGPRRVPFPVGHPRTGFNWPVTEAALRWGPRFLAERYGHPIYITENGLSTRDVVSVDGRVHDPTRIDFTTRYLRELRKALSDGADVRGYFHWSMMDNFEWAAGYRERFGLIFVDYATQERIPKDSYYWYRDVIASQGELALTTHSSRDSRHSDSRHSDSRHSNSEPPLEIGLRHALTSR